jgi:hypothetical protein
MKDEKAYTFDAILERLMLTDEEVLLCRQHREYGGRLDRMFGTKKPSTNCDDIGNIIGDPPDEPRVMEWKNRWAQSQEQFKKENK